MGRMGGLGRVQKSFSRKFLAENARFFKHYVFILSLELGDNLILVIMGDISKNVPKQNFFRVN